MKLLPAAVALVIAGCAAPPRMDATPEDYVRTALRALRAGQFEEAANIVKRAKQRYPDDPNVVLANARLMSMRGELASALSELLELTRREGSGVDHKMLMGMVGDTLFEMGRYGESLAYLQAAESETFAAKAKIAEKLPYVRQKIDVGSVELPLRDGDLPEMLCTFGDKQRPLVLDTGSTRTTMTKTLGAEIGVRHITDAGLGHDSVGTPFAAWLGVLPRFRVGKVELGTMPVTIVEDNRLALRDHFGGPANPPAGVVGLDVLSRFRTTFDPKRRSVILEASRDLKDEDAVSCVFHLGGLLAPVEVDDVRLWFAVDTGASHSSLSEDGLKALPGGVRRVATDHRRARTVGGTTVLVRQVRGLSVRCSAVRFERVVMSVVARPRTEIFPIHGVLGADLLMRCRVTLDGIRLLATYREK